MDAQISYSTNEVKTGATWIDGKPIYRQTIQVTAGASTDGWFHLANVSDIPNVAQYVKMRAIMNHNIGIKEELNGVYGLNSGAYYHVQSNYTTAGGVTFLTLEYTKTTD